MRIITGSLKGRSLSIPNNTDVRPTASRVKESLFSAIESRRYIQQCMILDLFAGSGSLGFEALSRDAKQVTFVDQNKKCLDYIKSMSKKFDIEDKVRMVRMDVVNFLTAPSIPCDIIFADPPYAFEDTEKILELVFEGGWLVKEGWLVLEHSKYQHFTQYPHFLWEKKYGRTYVSFFHA